MPNLFKSMLGGATDSIKSPMRVIKDIGKGDFGKAWADLKHIPGNQERANSKTLASVGIRGKVGQNPVVIPAAIFGGIFGAGALGAGSTAAGAGASTGGVTSGASAGGLGGAAGGAGGATGAMGLPTTYSGYTGATGTSSGFNWTQAISQMASAAPSGGMQQNQQAQLSQPQPLQSVARGFQPVNLMGTMAQEQPDYMRQINNILGGRNG